MESGPEGEGAALHRAGAGEIVTERSYGDFELTFDLKAPKGRDAGGWTLVGFGGGVSVAIPHRGGGWMSVKIRVVKGAIKVWADGKAQDVAAPGGEAEVAGEGPISLCPQAPAQIRRLRVRELK